MAAYDLLFHMFITGTYKIWSRKRATCFGSARERCRWGRNSSGSRCGGSQPPIGAPGAIAQSHATATYATRGGSWMLPSGSGAVSQS